MFKLLITGILFLTTISGYAQEFSAFTTDNTLHITLMGDTCNAMSAELRVDAICDVRRLTKNFVTTCSADLIVLSTEKSCMDSSLVPRVLSIDLGITFVAPEADILTLRYGVHSVDVKINK